MHVSEMRPGTEPSDLHTRLHLAIVQGDIEEAERVLELGSAEAELVEGMRTLLSGRRCLGPANRPSPGFVHRNRSPLIKALMREDLGMVRLLLKHGANVNARSAGNTPLSYVLLNTKDPEALRLLLHYGADPLQRIGDRSAAHHVLADRYCRHRMALLNWLLRAAPSLWEPQEELLEAAVQGGDAEALRTLLLRGCRGTPETDRLLLCKAARLRSSEVILELLRWGWDPRAEDADGSTAFHYAMFWDSPVERLKVASALLLGGHDLRRERIVLSKAEDYGLDEDMEVTALL